MLNTVTLRCCAASLSLAALSLWAAPAAAGDTLVVNGKSTPVDVRAVGGIKYVKLSDVAKALGMVLVKRGSQYELTKAGGTDQVRALTQGKIGDVLFDGYWRFQVQSLELADFYAPKKNPDNFTYDRSKGGVYARPNTQLVVMHCRVINGQKTVQTLWLAPVSGRSINNALTDTEGESYPPDGYDIDGTTSQSKPLLPGAKTDFTILFSVPEGTHLKDLVFTLQNNDSRPGNDVRVTLTP